MIPAQKSLTDCIFEMSTYLTSISSLPVHNIISSEIQDLLHFITIQLLKRFGLSFMHIPLGVYDCLYNKVKLCSQDQDIFNYINKQISNRLLDNYTL